MRGVVIELNPADDAVVLEILRDFIFIDAEMFGELRLQIIVAVTFPMAAFAAIGSAEIADTHAQGLASFHVLSSCLIAIGKQKHAGPGGRLIGFIQAMQRTRHEPSQRGFQARDARGESGIAGAAMRGAFGRQLRRRRFKLRLSL